MEHDSESPPEQPANQPDDEPEKEPQSLWIRVLKFIAGTVIVFVVVAALVFGVCLLVLSQA